MREIRNEGMMKIQKKEQQTQMTSTTYTLKHPKP
jgi:hypothetical protein